MKKANLLVAASLVLASCALFAQVHGVPPSVTSYGPGRGQAPGIPASVTSLGPNGYSNTCNQPGCNNAFFLYPPGSTHVGHTPHHPNGGGHHIGGVGYYGYGYIPYAYPVAVPVAVAPESPVSDTADQAAEPDPPAPTIFERRPDVQPAPYTTDINAEPSQGRHTNISGVSEEKIPVVIVFKDGHQQEIANGNYAIVGDLLYDLSGPIAHKYKLADLDLAQTQQLNEQRGVEFSLPPSYKPQV